MTRQKLGILFDDRRLRPGKKITMSDVVEMIRMEFNVTKVPRLIIDTI